MLLYTLQYTLRIPQEFLNPAVYLHYTLRIPQEFPKVTPGTIIYYNPVKIYYNPVIYPGEYVSNKQNVVTSPRHET